VDVVDADGRWLADVLALLTDGFTSRVAAYRRMATARRGLRRHPRVGHGAARNRAPPARRRPKPRGTARVPREHVPQAMRKA
jgi:hypothetical protein